MPRGDRTGPMGMGPRTGRAAGFCAGSRTPGYANPGPGLGLGRGFGGGGGFRAGGYGGGGGWGWRNQAAGNYYGRARGGRFLPLEAEAQSAAAGYAQDDEVQTLVSRTRALENELAELKKRLAEREVDSGV